MKRTVKEVAREVVGEIAPNELDLFEQIWAEELQNPQLLIAESGKSDRQLGVGVELSMASLMTLVIIPLVVGVAKDTAIKGVGSIVDYVKKRLGKVDAPEPSKSPTLSDDEIDRIARVIAERFMVKPIQQ